MAEAQAGHEVGVGDEDFPLGPVDGVQVGDLDGAAAAQVVPGQEFGALLARRFGMGLEPDVLAPGSGPGGSR
jgi:hypothetical protein